MADETKIEWADSTWNPWIGCTKISAACDHCYAEEWAKRFGQVQWGGSPRKRTSDANWRKPRKWNRDAAKSGKPHFVFCASLADVFDNQVPTEWRRDLWELIAETPHLTWLLLTKRPQNIARMLPNPGQHYPRGGPAWGEGWSNVWLGTTVENQEAADRNIPALLAVPAVKRFLSCEPLLGPIRLDDVCTGYYFTNVLNGAIWHEDADGYTHGRDNKGQRIDWVIAGGESGPNARPSHPDWFRSLRDQCAAADVPFLFKQWGEWVPCHCEDMADGHNSMAIFPDDACTDDPGSDHWADFKAKVIEAHGTSHWRVGKARAGRLLDGVQHDGRPEA